MSAVLDLSHPAGSMSCPCARFTPYGDQPGRNLKAQTLSPDESAAVPYAARRQPTVIFVENTLTIWPPALTRAEMVCSPVGVLPSLRSNWKVSVDAT